MGNIDNKKLESGGYCRKGVSGCYCKTGGRPYEEQCPVCRDTRDPLDNRDYCVCPHKDVTNGLELIAGDKYSDPKTRKELLERYNHVQQLGYNHDAVLRIIEDEWKKQ